MMAQPPPTEIMSSNDARLTQLSLWLTQGLARQVERIEVASADASFRRYFRVTDRDGSTAIAMDAPPDKENIAPYLKVARLLETTGVHVPHIYECDPAAGFVLLEDLGSTPYLARLQAGDDPQRLYGDALAALAQIQLRGRPVAGQLPSYDAVLLAHEMALMPEWLCTRHLQLQLQADERGLLRRTFDLLIAEALAQPQVFVHRDYHSRNLMVLPERNPGVIDFQDAQHGPVTYDLVSLLKDCYISWPRERVEEWVDSFRRRLLRGGAAEIGNAREFLRSFDLMGVQRHVKVLGIFARLWYRDGKSGYLADLPLTLEYVRDACARHAELGEFGAWLEQRIVPRLAEANAAALRG
jgi:aminoglycoside/choline kinase family phosphotransferase